MNPAQCPASIFVPLQCWKHIIQGTSILLWTSPTQPTLDNPHWVSLWVLQTANSVSESSIWSSEVSLTITKLRDSDVSLQVFSDPSLRIIWTPPIIIPGEDSISGKTLTPISLSLKVAILLTLRVGFLLLVHTFPVLHQSGSTFWTFLALS